MRKKLLASLLLGLTLVVGSSVAAATYTSSDGVLSMEAPNEFWAQTNDPNYWFSMSDGANVITISHLRNGEALPAPTVADGTYAASYMAYVSTKDEVFVVKALAQQEKALETLMKAVGTVKILQYGTLKAVEKAPTEAASAFGLRSIGGNYEVTADSLNVRTGCSYNDQVIGTLYGGDQVFVIGMVTKNGQDYGWYQINYASSTAYVSADFLAPAGTASKQSSSSSSSSSSEKEQAKETETPGTESITLYDEGRMSITISRQGKDDSWKDSNGNVFLYMADGIFYHPGSDSYWAEDPDYWKKNPNAQLDYDDYADSGDDADWEEITLYAEDGSVVNIFFDEDTDTWQDYKGLVYQPLAGALFIETTNGIYFDADPNYWKETGTAKAPEKDEYSDIPEGELEDDDDDDFDFDFDEDDDDDYDYEDDDDDDDYSDIPEGDLE